MTNAEQLADLLGASDDNPDDVQTWLGKVRIAREVNREVIKYMRGQTLFRVGWGPIKKRVTWGWLAKPFEWFFEKTVHELQPTEEHEVTG